MREPAIVVVLLVCAHAQASAQQASAPTSGVTPPPFYLDFAAFPQAASDVLTTTNDPNLFGNRDRLWEFRSGGARPLGKGIVVSADIVGRRGYRLPLYRSDLIGSNRSPVDVVNASVVDMSQPRVDWTVKLRIEKTFVQRKWEMRIVGELLAPVGRSDLTAVTRSAGFFDSRAVSIGIVLGF